LASCPQQPRHENKRRFKAAPTLTSPQQPLYLNSTFDGGGLFPPKIMSTRKPNNVNNVNLPHLITQIRACIAADSAVQSNSIVAASGRAKKMTEMDVRSPNFNVKATLFLTMIDIAAKKISPTATKDSIVEPPQLRKAVASLFSCVEEYNTSNTNGRRNKLSKQAKQDSYRTIFSQLVVRVLSIFTTLDAAQLILAKAPAPCTNPAVMFPTTTTRTMKSARACHGALDFLLMVAGRPSSRGTFIAKRGQKSRTKLKSSKNKSGFGNKNDLAVEQENPSAPSSPGSSSLSRGGAASPRSPVSLPSDFDYFGGASISTARMPLHPEKNKSMVRSSSGGAGGAAGTTEASASAIDQLKEKVKNLEMKLVAKNELNNRLMLQSKLIEESPESASLILDARRLMMVESRNYQLEKQRDVLLVALEGQQQVIDHTERILLELGAIVSHSKLGNKKIGNEGRENVAERIDNLLNRLKATSRNSARARVANLEEL